VATPHFSHTYPTRSEAADQAADLLRDALKAQGCGLDVLVGAEISIHNLHQLDRAALRRRTLGSGNCLLIEPPFGDGPDSIELMINDLMVDGFDVLIAHPERSGYLHSRPEILQRLVARGAYGSVTAASLQGKFGRSVKKEALRLCAAGLIHNVSSDAHDIRSRQPGLDTGRKPIEGLPAQSEMDSIAASLLGRT
jgi:protein-tyrosine phosphatase